jgi:hypothetical protein
MNMKVAGTLGNYLSQRVNVDGEEEEKKSNQSRGSNKCDQSMDSKASALTETEVWDKNLFVGLNAKQKKNLRKKL